MKRGRAEAALGRAAEQFSRLERSASEMKTDSKPEDDHDRFSCQSASNLHRHVH